VSGAGPLARRTVFCKFIAGVGPPLIDAAGHALPNSSGEGETSRLCVVCAPHAAKVFGQRVAEPIGYTPPLALEVVNREVHAKAGATCSAALTRRHGRCFVGEGSGQAAEQQVFHQGFLRVHAVLRFIPDDRLWPVYDVSVDFFAAVSWQAVHEQGVSLGASHHL
jgi:hypothetical protein